MIPSIPPGETDLYIYGVVQHTLFSNVFVFLSGKGNGFLILAFKLQMTWPSAGVNSWPRPHLVAPLLDHSPHPNHPSQPSCPLSLPTPHFAFTYPSNQVLHTGPLTETSGVKQAPILVIEPHLTTLVSHLTPPACSPAFEPLTQAPALQALAYHLPEIGSGWINTSATEIPTDNHQIPCSWKTISNMTTST